MKYLLYIFIAASFADLWSRAGNFDGSLKSANQCVETSPGNPECYYERALILIYMKMFNRSLQDLNKAIYLKNDVKKYHCSRAKVHQYFEHFDQSIPDFDFCIKMFKILMNFGP